MERICEKCGALYQFKGGRRPLCKICYGGEKYGKEYCEHCGKEFGKKIATQKFCCQTCSIEYRRNASLKNIKYLKLNERLFKMNLKSVEECKNKCPLFEIFAEYMKQIAESGKVEMIKTQAQQIKAMKARLENMQEGYDG